MLLPLDLHTTLVRTSWVDFWNTPNLIIKENKGPNPVSEIINIPPQAAVHSDQFFPSTTPTIICHIAPCCCLPTPMTLASGGSPMFPHVVHQPASPSIWPAVQSLRRGLSTNPGVTMWCVCGCS